MYVCGDSLTDAAEPGFVIGCALRYGKNISPSAQSSGGLSA